VTGGSSRGEAAIGWVVFVVASVVAASGLTVGTVLLRGLEWTPDLRSAMAVQLIGSALPALAIFAAGGLLALRQRRIAERQVRFTQLGLTRDLSGVALEGQDLRGLDLRHKDLRNANLRGADLRGVNLLGSDLRGAELTRADLRHGSLDGVDLRLAVLAGARLDDGSMHFADARGASFNRAAMVRFAANGSDFSALSADEVDELLVEGVMRHRLHPRWARMTRPNRGAATNLRDISAFGSSWVGANLRHADVGGADLRRADLNGQHYILSHRPGAGRTLWARFGSYIEETCVGLRSWRNVVIFGHTEPADLTGADLTRADLRFTSLERVRLVGAQIDGCKADDGQLAKAITVLPTEVSASSSRIKSLLAGAARIRAWKHLRHVWNGGKGR
jgi:uncharacterized protein YjbI with pentapeptide repeats